MIAVCGLSPNAAYWKLLCLATQNALWQAPSRLGNFIDLGHVSVELDQGERLCLLEGRGFNPVFALVETAWLIEGREDLAPLRSVLAHYEQYSDDGQTLNGAYGFRLRSYFGVDQINKAIESLRQFPTSRRVTLSLYAVDDLGSPSKDIPCNTQVILRIEEGRLAMTVINRSNDLWLGVPYNWFAFRGLQQLIATELEIPIGIQRHFSTCMHLYERDVEKAKHVVARNSIFSIKIMEENTEPMDMTEFLFEVPALSVANFGLVKSQRLSAFFKRYLNHQQDTSYLAEYSSDTIPQHSLDVALNQWFAMYKLPKAVVVPMQTMITNPDTPTHLTIQRWILSESDVSEKLLTDIRIAANNVSPFLHALLNQGLPTGVRLELDGSESINVSLHLVLEIVLGCLDPLLSNSPIGRHLRQRLKDIEKELGLPVQTFRGREMIEAHLKMIYEHILN